jgi:hypothetical protein
VRGKVIKSKRYFFQNAFRELARRTLTGFEKGVRESREEEELDRFFESYESSYSLTLNYPEDMLLETARMEGIEVEGREKLDIVKDMFAKKKR